MTAHPGGRKLGIHLILPPDLKKCEGLKDAVLDTDVLIIARPIRWNNHSALIQKNSLRQDRMKQTE